VSYQKLEEAFLQGDENEAAEIFNEMMRKSVRLGLFAALEDEVTALCGPPYHPDQEGYYRRAGSETGSVYINGTKEKITRPRVRHREEGEVELQFYKAAKNQRNLFAEVVSAVSEGMSTRSVKRHTKGAVSKSAASRMWVEKSMEQLEFLRSRPLADHDFVAIQIDGVSAGKQMIVLAVGIDLEGGKHALDFEIGSSESKAVVQALITRLAKRGIKEPANRRLLVIRDGSAAIAGAVRSHWPDALQQECLVHQERNVLDKLRKRDRAEGIGLFKRLREAQGKEAGEEAFEELMDFVSERNAAAALALGERKEVLLCVHRLNIPSTLNGTLTNTNIIENTIRNWRSATGNVKLWQEKETMVPRWTASGMLWAESGYRKVRGYRDLGELAASLASSSPSSLSSSSEAEANEKNSGSPQNNL
jgi:transposase-like protein